MGMGKAFSFRRESTRNFSYCLAIYDKKKKFSAINLKLAKFQWSDVNCCLSSCWVYEAEKCTR